MSEFSPTTVVLIIIVLFHQIGWNYFALPNQRILDLIISTGLRHDLMNFVATLLMINFLWPLIIFRRDIL